MEPAQLDFSEKKYIKLHSLFLALPKTGNTHARKALVSAAWKYTRYPRISVSLAQRHQHCSAETIAIRQRAQKRLFRR